MIFFVLLLAFSILTYFFVVVMLLPKIFIKNRYVIQNSPDRGIKRYSLQEENYVIVYEPSLSVRKHISQYMLIDKKGEKKIRCKIKDSIEYLDYDIAVFDNRNKIIEILNVKEMIFDRGYTEAVMLPERTSYVSLHLNVVDNERFEQSLNVKYQPVKMLLFLLSTIVFSIGVAFCVKVSYSNLFGGVFRESFVNSGQGTLLTLMVAGGLSLLGMLVFILTIIVRSSSKKGKKSR